MALELASLQTAIAQLREGLARVQTVPEDSQLRDGFIQRFQRTYELSHKMLKRYLEQAAANPQAYDAADFQYLIRSANEQGLLRSDWSAWRRFRELRGKTSHTYDEAVARDVAAEIPSFMEEAAHLLGALQARNLP
jgi:nucleotidyltransferase substrate binding protein (TIGR01987 family)